MKLYHIKHDYLVHIMCSKCQNASMNTFVKVVDSFAVASPRSAAFMSANMSIMT